MTQTLLHKGLWPLYLGLFGLLGAVWLGALPAMSRTGVFRRHMLLHLGVTALPRTAGNWARRARGCDRDDGPRGRWIAAGVFRRDCWWSGCGICRVA